IRVQCALAGMEEDDERRWPLLAREAAVLLAHGKGWARPVPHLVKRWRFRRGFVEGVTLSADAFLRVGDELLRVAPVREVRLLHAGDRMSDLARSPLLGRLTGLDLRHTPTLTPERFRPLLSAAALSGLRSLWLRGTGLCTGSGLRALAACPHLAGLTALDVRDFRRHPVPRPGANPTPPNSSPFCAWRP